MLMEPPQDVGVLEIENGAWGTIFASFAFKYATDVMRWGGHRRGQSNGFI